MPASSAAIVMLEVITVAGDDVDDVDVVALEQPTVVAGHVRDLERSGGLVCGLLRDVAHGDELAPRIPLPAGQVSHVRPPAGTDHSDS